MNPSGRNTVIALGAVAMLAMSVAGAEDSVALLAESNRLERNTALLGQIRTGTRIIQDYIDFAGARANASSLVMGLRRGTPIALAAAADSGQDAAWVSFTPPISALNDSAVYISLALARQQLENLGIPRPTPDQIKAVLVGGTVSSGGAAARTTTLPGVLTLRNRGMSWTSIARSQGMNLDAVVDGMQGANHDLGVLHLHYVGAAGAAQTPADSPTMNSF